MLIIWSYMLKMFVTFVNGKSLMNTLEDTEKFLKGWNNWANSNRIKGDKDKIVLKKPHKLLYM